LWMTTGKIKAEAIANAFTLRANRSLMYPTLSR
jgi:hypothetical protein